MSQRSPRASDLLDRRRFLPARVLVARAGLAWAALALASVAPWPAAAQVSDDFSSANIDTSKWQDTDAEPLPEGGGERHGEQLRVGGEIRRTR